MQKRVLSLLLCGLLLTAICLAALPKTAHAANATEVVIWETNVFLTRSATELEILFFVSS